MVRGKKVLAATIVMCSSLLIAPVSTAFAALPPIQGGPTGPVDGGGGSSTSPNPPVITSNSDITSQNATDYAISGTGTPGDTVNITFTDSVGNQVSGTATVGSDSTWSATVDLRNQLVNGTVVISAIQTDQNGNISPVSNSISVTDSYTSPTAPPVITSNGDITSQNATDYSISGTGTPGDTVNIALTDSQENSSFGTATVGSDSTWSATVDLQDQGLLTGTVVITATQSDQDGNISPVSNSVPVTNAYSSGTSTSTSSSSPLTQDQLNDPTYVEQLEQQSIQNYIQQHGLNVVSTSETSTDTTPTPSVSTSFSSTDNPQLQSHMDQVNQELQDPNFQAQLTADWGQANASTATSSTSGASAVTPDSVAIPKGAWEVKATHSNDPGLYKNADKTAYNYSVGLTIAEDIASYFLSTEGNICLNVIEVVGSVALNRSQPEESILYHQFDYGYKDVYIYNGSQWVDCFTTTDREWYRHELTSYIGTNGDDYTKTYDFNKAHGYSWVHQDHGKYYNDSNTTIYNEGYLYYVDGRHGYDQY